jgi:uncharacterized protein YchJ
MMLERAGLKPTPRLNIKPAPWLLDSSLPCACGSDKAYSNCCEPLIKARKDSLAKDAAKQFGEGNVQEAEALYRAHFVQYLEWIYAHTLPLIQAGIEIKQQIVDVDIDALTELADTIAHCFYAEGKEDRIPAFMKHVKTVVPLEEFQKSSSYLNALWLYIALNDKDGAIQELKRLGNILDYPHREAWELYLDVVGSEISERQKILIAEQIVAAADEDEHVRTQYTVLKALALIQIGEGDLAQEAFETLLRTARLPAQIQTSDELAATWQIAKAHSLYGELYSDAKALRNAEELLRKIPETMLKPAGKAALRRDLGWVLRDQERYCDAAEEFRRSLEYKNTQVGTIHFIHSLALCGKHEEARQVLDGLIPAEVKPNLQLEYFAAQGSFAIATGDTALATQTAEGLRAVMLDGPFWDAQRKQLMIQMMDFAQRPTSTPQPERQHVILRVLLFMNDVLELKPHFFGVGVNINKVIEKLAKKNKSS